MNGGAPSNRLIRLALLLCPREFRDRYADEIEADALRGDTAAVLADALKAGFAMRAEECARTFRSAWIALCRSPLSTVVSVLSIALAIGASVAIASVLNGVLFRSLPYARSGDLVFVSQYTKDLNLAGLSLPDAQRVASETRTLSGIAVENGMSETLLGHGTPEQLDGRLVSQSYFGVLGSTPRLGRYFQPGDVHAKVALISERLWQRYYASSPAVLGSTIRLKDFGATANSYTIVGVVPDRFRDASRYGLRRSDYWLLAVPGTNAARPGRYFDSAVARLRPGVPLQSASADAARVLSHVAATSPREHLSGKALVTPLLQTIVGPVTAVLWLLYAAVAAVTLIACANVGSLNLARLIARESELLIRTALGASRRRLAVQISAEAATIAVAGAAFGIGIGYLALRGFAAYGAAFLPRWEDVRIDGTVLTYTLALTVAVTFVTGTLPALLRVNRRFAAGVPTGRSPGESASVKRACAAFVVTEAALCIAITICAGIVLRSFLTLTHADIGFNPGPNAYDVQFYPLPPGRSKDVLAKVRAIPGVEQVAASDDVPFANYTQNFTSVHVLGNMKAAAPMVEMIDANPAYFGVMNIPLLGGRAFTARDVMTSKPVAIVNASFAKAILHTASPLEKEIVPDTYAGPHPVTRTIVGVVGDIRDSRSQLPQPQIYVPLDQIGDPTQLVIRIAPGARNATHAVQAIFEQADRSSPPPLVVSFRTLFAQDTTAAGGNAALFGGLALIALLLALAGMYAVASYSTQRRTHEFGIRKAIGASDAAVLRVVLGATLVQAAIGICLGLVVAAAGARFLSAILYHTSPGDPLTFVVVAVLFAACAAIATLVPAMRAMRADPIFALRYE